MISSKLYFIIRCINISGKVSWLIYSLKELIIYNITGFFKEIAFTEIKNSIVFMKNPIPVLFCSVKFPFFAS